MSIIWLWNCTSCKASLLRPHWKQTYEAPRYLDKLKLLQLSLFCSHSSASTGIEKWTKTEIADFILDRIHDNSEIRLTNVWLISELRRIFPMSTEVTEAPQRLGIPTDHYRIWIQILNSKISISHCNIMSAPVTWTCTCIMWTVLEQTEMTSWNKPLIH